MIALPHRFQMGIALVAIAAVCVFLPGLPGGFIFDDGPNIVENQSVHLTDLGLRNLLYAAYSFQPGNGSRALSMLSFSLDHLRGGLDPAVFKATNLAIHALTVLALALFSRKLLLIVGWSPKNAGAAALGVALLWAIHPLQVSSVLYVVQRMQTLVSLFTAFALWAYLCMRQAQMEGRRSRGYGVLVCLFWVLALASKEDAALLPLYMLALEFTVLHFAAAQPKLKRILRYGFLWGATIGVVLYLFVVVPHYWSWGAYPTRDFSSYERLLTQGRVLVMYLGQMVFPWPGFLSFYYDDLVVSRGWLQPVTTICAWVFLAFLAGLAWRMRVRRPLFSFGVLLFFSGHFMTSNVIALEMAFEHRNHFPLVGVLLAVLDMGAILVRRFSIRPRVVVVMVALVCTIVGATTITRAYEWGEPQRFAKYGVEVAPRSARAWLALCGDYFERSRGDAASPWLGYALDTCQHGAEVTASAPMLSNVVIIKTIRGDVDSEDWERLLVQLRQATMTHNVAKIAMITLDNLDRGVPLGEDGVLKTFEILGSRADFSSHEYLRMAAYIYNESHRPAGAYFYLHRAVEVAPPGDPEVEAAMRQLEGLGRDDWVNRLREIQSERSRSGGSAKSG